MFTRGVNETAFPDCPPGIQVYVAAPLAVSNTGCDMHTMLSLATMLIKGSGFTTMVFVAIDRQLEEVKPLTIYVVVTVGDTEMTGLVDEVFQL